MQTTTGPAPQFLDAVVQRAMALYDEGQFNSADLLFATIAEEPRLKPFVLHMRGLIARQLGFKDEARRLLRLAVEADPTAAPAHANLGMLLLEGGHAPEALCAFAAALALNPRAPSAHCGLARAFAGLGMADLAIDADRDAIELQPDFPQAEIHLCGLLTDLGRGGEAAERLRAALARHPDDAALHQALALCLLTMGDWAAAWAELEWRWAEPRHGTDPLLAGFPRWRGEDVIGRTVLLQAEPNPADSLQLCRYAPLVKERGARVILRCPDVLVPLLRTLDGVDAVVPADQPLPDFDLMAPLLSLPGLFHTQPDAVPATIPYLHAAADRVEEWRRRLGPGEGLRVGLDWSIPGEGEGIFDLLRPLLDCPGVDFVRLTGAGTDDRLWDPGWSEPSLAEAAELTAALDLVIAVDGPIAHLAGALGKAVWILVPAAGDWRWLRERTDTPWYPRARLFRQAAAGRWDEVAERVGAALRQAVLCDGAVEAPVPPVAVPPPNPLLADALFAEATRHHQANAPDRAARLYERALSLDPDHINSLTNLGALVQGRPGGAERARRLLERAVVLAPGLAPAHRALADLLRGMGAFEDAVGQYRQALAAAPTDPLAHAGLAMALRAMEDYEAAMVHFRQAVALDRGQSATFFQELGQTLVALDRLDGAEVALQHAVTLDSTLRLAHCALGQIYLETGRSTHAAASFRRALAIDAQCIPARRGLDRLGEGRNPG